MESKVMDGCEVLDERKTVISCRTQGFEARRWLFGRVVVPAVLYGADKWEARAE